MDPASPLSTEELSRHLTTLIGWSDIPMALLVIVLSHILRPLFDPDIPPRYRWQGAFAGDRIITLPLLLGVVIGLLLERLTETFSWSVAIRRSLATGAGAAAGFKLFRAYAPAWAERLFPDKRVLPPEAKP